VTRDDMPNVDTIIYEDTSLEAQKRQVVQAVVSATNTIELIYNLKVQLVFLEKLGEKI